MAGEQQQQTGQDREYSLTELDQAVASGNITQTQRDQIWTSQVEKRTARTAEETARTVVQEEVRNDNLDRHLQEYVTLVPDLGRDDSPIRQRVKAEFDYLVNQGLDPKSLSTELAAVRAAMGPLERVRQHVSGQRRGPDAFGDTQQRQLSPEQRREANAWDRLDQRTRNHYDDLIRKRVYPDRAAALGELKRSAERRAQNLRMH